MRARAPTPGQDAQNALHDGGLADAWAAGDDAVRFADLNRTTGLPTRLARCSTIRTKPRDGSIPAGPVQNRVARAGRGGGRDLFRSDHAVRAEAAEDAVSRTRERKTSTSYALGWLCECGARRPRWFAPLVCRVPLFESAMGDEQRRGPTVSIRWPCVAVVSVHRSFKFLKPAFFSAMAARSADRGWNRGHGVVSIHRRTANSISNGSAIKAGNSARYCNFASGSLISPLPLLK